MDEGIAAANGDAQRDGHAHLVDGRGERQEIGSRVLPAWVPVANVTFDAHFRSLDAAPDAAAAAASGACSHIAPDDVLEETASIIKAALSFNFPTRKTQHRNKNQSARSRLRIVCTRRERIQE